MKDSSITHGAHFMSVDDADALAIIRGFLDSPGTVAGKKENLRKLTGRQMARVADTPEGRDVLKALAFHAALTGGASSVQLKAIDMLLNRPGTAGLSNFDKIRASRNGPGGEKIEVVAERNGSGDAD